MLQRHNTSDPNIFRTSLQRDCTEFRGPRTFAEMGGFQLHCWKTEAEVQGIERGQAKLEGVGQLQLLYRNGQCEDAGMQFSCLSAVKEPERL